MGLEKEPLEIGDGQQDEQGQILDALVQAGKWSEINPEAFPGVFKPTLEFAREQAFDVRIYCIGLQMNQLLEMMDLFSGDKKIQELVNGRILELKNEIAGILVARFPDTKPVRVSKPKSAPIHLDLDTDAAVQFFINVGEVEALTPENIPALKLLKPETLMGLQMDALLAKLSRYGDWKSAAIGEETYGFSTSEDGSQRSNLGKLADEQITNTRQQIDSLSKKRLSIPEKTAK